MPAPEPRPLTIRDDDPAPAVTLVLSMPAIVERRGVATVTATLDHPSSAVTTVRIQVDPVAPAEHRDFRQIGSLLTIPARATASTGSVSVRAVDNSVDAPDRTVNISGVANNRHGVAGNPEALTLTIQDDESAPTLRLELGPSRISERGGSSEVTAWLDHGSSAHTIVRVSASAVGPAEPSYYTVSAETVLTIPADARRSEASVRIDAVDDESYGPSRRVSLTAAADNEQGVVAALPRVLTITEDDPPPVVSLVLSTEDSDEQDESAVVLDENAGAATLTVAVDRAFDRDTTYEVALAPLAPAVAGDFTLGPGTVLTIAAGATSSSSALTITAVDNDVDAPDVLADLTAVVRGASGVAPPDIRTVTIRDDDAPPAVTLTLVPTAIDERGAVTALSAALDHPSSEPTTIFLIVEPEAHAVEGDLRLSRAYLTIPARALDSHRSVLITAVDNDVDAPVKRLEIAGIAHNLQGLAGDPIPVALSITDDETAPTVSLVLSPAAIVENGGRSTVTARLDHPSQAETTLSVTTAPDSVTYYTRAGSTLTVAAGQRTSTGVVRIVAIDDDQDALDRRVTVTATAANAHEWRALPRRER